MSSSPNQKSPKPFLIGCGGLILAVAIFGFLLDLSGFKPKTSVGSAAPQGEPAKKKPEFQFEKTPEKLSRGLVQGVEKGFRLSRDGWMTRSKSHKDAYYAAFYLEGAGVQEWAVWLASASELKAGGEVGGLSVNPAAKEFSDWGDATKADSEARASDPECVALLQYAKGKGKSSKGFLDGSANRKR
jgi:hypothetical protein